MKRSMFRAGLLLLVLSAFCMFGCSKPEAKNETVAQVNGDSIRASELREFLGVRGGESSAAAIPVERKKEALDRLIVGRLLEQEARDTGLDNTDEFRSIVQASEKNALISALFRKEFAAKVKVSKEEIQAEAKKMMAADNTLTQEKADLRARRAVSDRLARKMEEDLIGSATKQFPFTIVEDTVKRIAKGENVADNAVLASGTIDNVTYGDLAKVLESMGGRMHERSSMLRNPMVVAQLLNRETTGRALAAYAKKQGIEGSEWHKSSRRAIDRSILIELLAERLVKQEVPVSDKEIRDTYNEHPEAFVRKGRKVPLSKVKEQIRSFLQNEKRKETIHNHIEELKKKAKITVNEKVLREGV